MFTCRINCDFCRRINQQTPKINCCVIRDHHISRNTGSNRRQFYIYLSVMDADELSISSTNNDHDDDEQLSEEDVDPIHDIIDYLVRYAKVSFKNAHINEENVKTSDKIKMAHNLYTKSPIDFLMQFGKYLAPYHIGYFEKLQPSLEDRESYKECIADLKRYHSDDIKHKRVRNRRFKALEKLRDETDYFSEKQMMFRNPLLYEQLVGQYLTDEEIRQRDGADNENLTFLSMILDTVDRNQMRRLKNEQLLEENAEILENTTITTPQKEETTESKPRSKAWGEFDTPEPKANVKKQWGDFDRPDPTPTFTPETRMQSMISAPERHLLRQEFLQEMYSSFIDGRDVEVDYHTIDNDEQYDDLKQFSQDAEDRYFDSEANDAESLEDHMKLMEVYGSKKSADSTTTDDPLDEFMMHITKKQNKT